MKDTAKKVMYATVGAPVLAGRKVAELSRSMATTARKEYEAAADEGQELTKQVRKSNVVEELSSRLDLDEFQGRVDKLRDQLEDVLANWREQFRPETRKAAVRKTETAKVTTAVTTAKPQATTVKKTTVKKTATKAPAAKKTTAKAPAAKKATTKAPAAKKTSTKSAS